MLIQFESGETWLVITAEEFNNHKDAGICSQIQRLIVDKSLQGKIEHTEYWAAAVACLETGKYLEWI